MSKIKGIRFCSWCNKEIEIFHEARLNRNDNFCCKKCEANFRKSQSVKNCICPMCQKEFHVKPSHKNRYKNVFCSLKCKKEYDSQKMSNEGNHQYGLKGKLNASWKSDKRISSYGYNLIRKLDHPFCNCDGFVFEHRLIAEAHYLTNENSEIINGVKYLSPDWVVHHIDFNKTNNELSNLFPLPAEIHISFHSRNKDLKEKSIEEKRNRFFDFIKNKKECSSAIRLYYDTNGATTKICGDVIESTT